MDKITKIIANELNIRENQVESAVKLIDEGNTIPFIARYRKEATGGLSDETLRDLGERLTYLRNLEKRKEEVKKKRFRRKTYIFKESWKEKRRGKEVYRRARKINRRDF